jgi:hypothetical protein
MFGSEAGSDDSGRAGENFGFVDVVESLFFDGDEVADFGVVGSEFRAHEVLLGEFFWESRRKLFSRIG